MPPRAFWWLYLPVLCLNKSHQLCLQMNGKKREKNCIVITLRSMDPISMYEYSRAQQTYKPVCNYLIILISEGTRDRDTKIKLSKITICVCCFMVCFYMYVCLHACTHSAREQTQGLNMLSYIPSSKSQKSFRPWLIFIFRVLKQRSHFLTRV